MQVPLLDLKAQMDTIRGEVKAAIDDVVESTHYILGPEVEKLENTIAEYSGSKYGVGLSSGTDALLIALMALDIKTEDLVITSPYSFFATAGTVARLNATPVFVDIDPKTYNLDPNLLRKWFSENPDKTERVKAIIPVHLFGQCADMDAILEIACQYKIPVIEDAAQAIGAKYPSKTGSQRAGSMGIMGCFSFFPSKNLGCMGDGGMVVTNDETLYQKLIKLRNHGSAPKYYHALIGGNFRLDAIQAAVLNVKIKYLEEWHKGRRKNAEYYDNNLTVPGPVKPFAVYGRDNHIYNQYILLVPEKRNELRKFLNDSGIGNEVYYPVPFHEQECFEYLGYKAGDFPHSEYASVHTIAIPIYPELTIDMQNYVISKIEEFYK
ncbi:MAG: DegT/DnrJ/EryC1/StrS family aminotransferase [Candidatus Marinimicrobia bacterium]|nr:DegT/DnrJ/EryC1/StrS family aminotransferase [Candidatus Neomarinimicrobiota bacterium]